MFIRVLYGTALAAALLLTGCAGSNKDVASGSDPAAEGAINEMLKVDVPKPDVVPASAWGSEPDAAALESRRHVPRYVTIHHAGVAWKDTDEPHAKIKGLQSWGARDRGWPDVPYHFLIPPDGRIFEGRSVEFEPETNTNYDVTGHVGINVYGNFEEQRVREEQLAAVVDTVAWLCDDFRIPTSQITTHKDVAPGQTSCPGADLYRYVENGMIRRWVEKKLAGEAYEIELLPATEGGPTEFVPYGVTSVNSAEAAS